MSDSSQSTAGTECAEPLGNAEELGIAVYEGVDPSQVTVYDDGTHRGPPRFEETDKRFEGYAGMSHYLKAMYCPCGHFIRRVTYTDQPELDSVRCEGPTMTVERLRSGLGESERDSSQQTLTESVATDGGHCVEPGTDHAGGDSDA